MLYLCSLHFVALSDKETGTHALAARTNIYNNLRVSRFLLVTLPLRDCLYPVLAIGQELVNKEHEVIWCGPVNVLRPLVGPDATVHPAGRGIYRRADDVGLTSLRTLWDEYLVPFTRSILDAVDVAVTEHRPDVVVADQYALAGALVAHRRSVPWATLAIGALELTPPADLPGLAGFVADRVAQLAALAGLPAGEPFDPRFSPHLVIALTTRGLVGTAELPDRCVLTGAALGTRPDAPDFPWHAWDHAARHVLVKAGNLDAHTTEGFHRRMAAALGPMAPEVQAVFVVSGMTADSFPDNAITAERVPMLDLMPRLDVVACQAGSTVTEALAYGVPLVVAPVRPEQVALARQVTAAGAGIEISMPDATTADLAAAVRAVLYEPDFREHARLIAAEFAAAGGAAAAAAHLAALASGAWLSPASASPAPLTMFDVLRSLRESTATVTDGAGMVPMSAVCDQAARLARTLTEYGVGPDTRVGVCVGRGIGMLTALLGVWWAGGAIVPLEPEYPLPRLETMARDAGLRLVVSDDDHARLAGSLGGDLTVITPERNAAEPLDPIAAPADALAYTVFTSGPAGPTGVDITRRALANVLAVGRRDLGLGPGDRFVAVTTAAFDITLLELFLPLVCGTSLVIAAAEDTREASRLRSLIERNAATALHATPHIWRLLVGGGGVPASLRLRLCSGDRLPPDLAASLTAPDAVLWHFYGHTETTMWTAAGAVAAGEGPVVIGPAIDRTRVYVLDGRSAQVPVGVVGEVHIAGVGVARGCLGHHRHMSTAFRPDPWATEPGARMYATGDLGRWREDGGLELVGGTGRRVTIRGVRVDCGEVEAVLRTHHAIRDAAVVGVPREGETALVAYVVSDSDGPARSATELLTLVRPHLRAALPEPMVPTLVTLPALPLTRDGEVDRAALPAPEWTVTRVLPRNPVETAMVRIWADLLGTTEPIGPHDNLFDLGSGSLAIVRFAAWVADTYGVDLAIYRIASTPTIAALAEIVSADLNSAHIAETAGEAGLAALSDEDLDDLLRVLFAARDRRRAAPRDGR
jgi:zeaxanthin glucosyltransferase